jgi:hypothetical protein
MGIRDYQLVNRFVKFFQVQQSLAKDEDKDTDFQKPFITIAREPGSGGVPIANAVAQKLGFTCVDEQLIEEIARSTKLRRELIRAVDEKKSNQCRGHCSVAAES